MESQRWKEKAILLQVIFEEDSETIEVFFPIEVKFNNSKLKVELNNLALKY
ncbi:hypothetical protein CLSAP_17770 [Clostridium saccharoperbutylacetonicum]|nr:hypothetical protein CLSAP_17770 [Clostridium saccharoperbutylacetonicum]NSB30174.1 hypothetical protein [Clostridium saccharoperbutylacetonicum]